MIEFFFSMIASVIVIPLIIFLPLGLTRRGKWNAAIGALLIGVLGVGAGELLVYWQAVFVILLVSILTGFLAEKQSGIYGYAEVINNHENVSGAPALDEVISQSINTDSVQKNDDEHTIDLPEHRLIKPKIVDDLEFLERQQESVIEDSPVPQHGYLKDIEKMLDFQQKSNDEEQELWDFIEAK